MKVRKLLSEEHEERLKQSICPRCKSHQLIEVVKGNETPKLKYDPGHVFWACSGPLGQKCFLISSCYVDTIFETSEETKPVSFNEEQKTSSTPYTGARIIRRRKGEISDITHFSLTL